MKWKLDFQFDGLKPGAGYTDKILMAGSCFAENISATLAKNKFDVIANPHGILYNPASIVHSLFVCLENKKYSESDLFFDHGLWHIWDCHERFSDPDKDTVLNHIHSSIETAHQQLYNADWLILTFGTAGIYHLKEDNRIVGNCHKRPSSDFVFSMMEPGEIVRMIKDFTSRLFHLNKKVKIIFTVSPVRYIRYGLVESNVSKAILLYAVHQLTLKSERLFYFPAYEIVTDELRDYRFFADDLVHPNNLATQYVWEKFTAYFLSEQAKNILNEISPLLQAVEHEPLHPSSDTYKQFAAAQVKKIRLFKEKYPFLNFEKELNYFSQSGISEEN